MEQNGIIRKLNAKDTAMLKLRINGRNGVSEFIENCCKPLGIGEAVQIKSPYTSSGLRASLLRLKKVNEEFQQYNVRTRNINGKEEIYIVRQA